MNAPRNLCRIALPILLGLMLLACPREEVTEATDATPPWPSGRLVSVVIGGDGAILVAAEHGEILRSEDAGKSWRLTRTPAVKSLSALSMAMDDPSVGWAVGDGVILKTDEAGLAWRRQRLPRRADDVQLMGVAALDRNRAIAVGADGLRFYTHDGGAVWRSVSGPLVAPTREEPALGILRAGLQQDLHDDLYDVVCEDGRLNRCWAVGERLYLSRDMGISWEAVPVSHFDSMEPIEFSFAGVEIPAEDADRIRSLATKWRYVSPLTWRIEVSILASEVERIGRQRDAAALLEIIEARAQEARSLLESAGIDATRIEVLGEPPWNYEDSLDEDPELLDRYFAERTRDAASVRIHLDDQARLYALALTADGHAVAVGEAGKVVRRVRRASGGFAWEVGGRVGKHDLFAVAMAPDGRPILVGAQGGFWVVDGEYDPDQPAKFAERGAEAAPDGSSASFGAFRAIAFGSGPQPIGVAVGELGLIWVSEGVPPSFRVRTSPAERAQEPDVTD